MLGRRYGHFLFIKVNIPFPRSQQSAKALTMNENAAETIALKCLAWLAGEDALLPVFLGASGASESDLRSRAADKDFLTSVLDFISMDDAWVVQCCDAQNLGYEQPMMALGVLQGASRTHWT